MLGSPLQGETEETVPIRNTAFSGVQARLGAYPITRPFELAKIVIPVSLVDSDVTLNASSSTPLINVPSSAGELVAPAANTRLANTGPLPAGPYTMVFWISTAEANGFRVRRRNAADTLDVWAHRYTGGVGTQNFALRLLLALNEFVVVENTVVGTAGFTYQASIFTAAG